MLFSSLIFLFAFLPLVLAFYYFAPQRAKNGVLLAFSLLFYAWGGLNAFYAMLAIIAVNYAAALGMTGGAPKKFFDKIARLVCVNPNAAASKRAVLAAALALDFGILFYFKYMGFVANGILNLGIPAIALPIGISFYIFQAASYLIDVYRGDAKVQKNPFTLALFISLFPQLVAGPIVRYDEVDEQLAKRKILPEDILYGARRFIIGLGKKVLIANTMAKVADSAFNLAPGEIGTTVAWVGAIAYAFQIFFDFSGYSDMAIGLLRIFGFRIPENFNYPYIAKSITDFWRRWHISLSTWFKDYLYIPLGGNRTGRAARNLWLVFLATGLWHGAEWSFILWGMWHGLFIVMEKKIGVEKFKGVLARAYTLAVVLFGWVLFRAENIGAAGKYIGKMFGFGNYVPTYDFAYFVDNIELIAFAVAALLSTPIFANILRTKREWLLNLWLVLILFASAAMLAGGAYNPFIYFRF